MPMNLSLLQAANLHTWVAKNLHNSTIWLMEWSGRPCLLSLAGFFGNGGTKIFLIMGLCFPTTPDASFLWLQQIEHRPILKKLENPPALSLHSLGNIRMKE
ncbi:hypothetical protein GBA52_015069 [Prunus armeniaca]|nr:hypothetical protein GBA52_015069 [Prunus armeniaca]